MPFEYSCFISYRHTDQKSGNSFIEQFYEALSIELGRWTDKKVYLDNERLKAGYFYNEELAEALCKSVCMIAVYTRQYFSLDHSYCAREYKAMESLEKERLKLLNNLVSPKHGLIIPIIHRDVERLPREIKDRRQYDEFVEISLRGSKMKKYKDFNSKIMEIAKYISDRCLEFEPLSEDPCKNCFGFTLPKDEDIREFLEGIIQGIQAFPGRGVI